MRELLVCWLITLQIINVDEFRWKNVGADPLVQGGVKSVQESAAVIGKVAPLLGIQQAVGGDIVQVRSGEKFELMIFGNPLQIRTNVVVDVGRDLRGYRFLDKGGGRELIVVKECGNILVRPAPTVSSAPPPSGGVAASPPQVVRITPAGTAGAVVTEPEATERPEIPPQAQLQEPQGVVEVITTPTPTMPQQQVQVIPQQVPVIVVVLPVTQPTPPPQTQTQTPTPTRSPAPTTSSPPSTRDRVAEELRGIRRAYVIHVVGDLLLRTLEITRRPPTYYYRPYPYYYSPTILPPVVSTW